MSNAFSDPPKTTFKGLLPALATEEQTIATLTGLQQLRDKSSLLETYFVTGAVHSASVLV